MGEALVLVLELFLVLLIARAFLSWIRVRPGEMLYPMARSIHVLTEPVLAPIRRVLPRTGPIDLSLTVVMLVVGFVLIPIVSRF
jgi:YggT family protein